MRIKQTLGAIVLAGAIGLTGCIKTETPYKPIPMSESQNYNGQKVIVEGLPSLIRNEGFVIRNGENELYVKPGVWGSASFAKGDYNSAKQALQKEATDSDEEKVKVYGVLGEDNTIEGRFVDVEGTLHEFYK